MAYLSRQRIRGFRRLRFNLKRVVNLSIGNDENISYHVWMKSYTTTDVKGQSGADLTHRSVSVALSLAFSVVLVPGLARRLPAIVL